MTGLVLTAEQLMALANSSTQQPGRVHLNIIAPFMEWLCQVPL